MKRLAIPMTLSFLLMACSSSNTEMDAIQSDSTTIQADTTLEVTAAVEAADSAMMDSADVEVSN